MVSIKLVLALACLAAAVAIVKCDPHYYGMTDEHYIDNMMQPHPRAAPPVHDHRSNTYGLLRNKVKNLEGRVLNTLAEHPGATNRLRKMAAHATPVLRDMFHRSHSSNKLHSGYD